VAFLLLFLLISSLLLAELFRGKNIWNKEGLWKDFRIGLNNILKTGFCSKTISKVRKLVLI
jgi:hypothetical protein